MNIENSPATLSRVIEMYRPNLDNANDAQLGKHVVVMGSSAGMLAVVGRSLSDRRTEAYAAYLLQASDLVDSGFNARALAKNGNGWAESCRKTIEELGQLASDWDSYGGQPPNNIAISKAHDLIRYLSYICMRPTVVAPLADGGIGFTFRSRDRLASIEIDNEGEILALLEEGDKDPYVWSLGFDISYSKKGIDDLKGFLRNASTSPESQRPAT